MRTTYIQELGFEIETVFIHSSNGDASDKSTWYREKDIIDGITSEELEDSNCETAAELANEYIENSIFVEVDRASGMIEAAKGNARNCLDERF